MFAKVFVICAALAAAQASLIASVGYGAPVHAAGPLSIGKGLIAAPAVATVSSQKAVINHVAPASHVAFAPAPVAGHRLLANGLVGAHGISAAPLAVDTSVYGSPVALGVGNLGYGHGAVVSVQKSVINHVAPAAPVAVAAAPVAVSSHGIIGGHGILAAPHAVGTSVYGAPVGNLVYGHGSPVSSQKSVINHVAPAAPVSFASQGIHGNGLLANGLVGGHGIAAPLAIGNGLLGASVALGHGHAVSSQKSVINHVAPAAPIAVAAAPVALSSHGIHGNGIVAGHGLLGAPVALGHGHAVSSQKSVISHVAPAARVTVAPVALSHNGILSNGLIGGHGIVGNGLVAGAPLGIAGHEYSAYPLSIGRGIHGAPVGLDLGKHVY